MASSRNFKERLLTGKLVIAPGAYDGITGGAIERAGFAAAYMTGSGVSASHGFPDRGLLSASEMTLAASKIARSINIPLIADADTGYGNELNVARTIVEYEQAGVAAIQIEDQTFPKRCGHFENATIIPVEEMEGKIRAAVAARSTSDFLIVARTDAIAIEGIDAAIERANRYVRSGADIAFVEAPLDLQQMARIPREIEAPCLLNIVWRGRTPEVSFSDVEAMGYSIAILPSILLKSVLGICGDILGQVDLIGKHPVPPGDINVQLGAKMFGGAGWQHIKKSVNGLTD